MEIKGFINKLNENDIEKWNKSSPIGIRFVSYSRVDALTFNRYSDVSVVRYDDYNRNPSNFSLRTTGFKTKHTKMFSISKDGVNLFDEIFDIVFKSPSLFNIYDQVEGTTSKVDINNLSIEFTKKEQMFLNREYVLYTYEISGNLFEIMLYDKIISNALDIYNSVVNNMRFEPHDIVCVDDDRTKDSIILKTIITPIDEGYNVEYLIADIIENDIISIEYDNHSVVSSNRLRESRNVALSEINKVISTS